MRIFFFCVLLSISYLVSGQQNEVERVKAEFVNIVSEKQAEKFVTKNHSLKGAVVRIDPKVDSSAFAKSILTKHTGEILEQQSGKSTHLFKVLKTEQVQAYRVQYIFFNKAEMSMTKIKSLRELILKRLENGEAFEIQAKEYSMDANASKGGDLGWFEENQLVKEFENAVKSHALGEVFTVDVPSQGWYYVVKNTHNPRIDTVVTGLYAEISM